MGEKVGKKGVVRDPAVHLEEMCIRDRVYVDGRKVDKAGTQVGPGCAIEVRGRTLA